eukprot:3782279-Amphidinium_carterae.1
MGATREIEECYESTTQGGVDLFRTQGGAPEVLLAYGLRGGCPLACNPQSLLCPLTTTVQLCTRQKA